MAAETASTVVNSALTNSAISNDISWIRTHAFVVLGSLFLAGVLIMGSLYEINNIIEQHDAKNAAQSAAVLKQATDEKNALLAQMQQDEQQFAIRDAQEQATIASLAKQMAASRAATQVQVQKDSTLSSNDAATRLAQQTSAAPGEITVSGDIVSIDLPITRKITEDEDKLVQANSDVTNLTGQLQAETILTQDAKSDAADKQKVIDADKTQLVAQIKADNEACDVKVDKARKHGLWGTIGGLIGGFILGHIY